MFIFILSNIVQTTNQNQTFVKTSARQIKLRKLITNTVAEFEEPTELHYFWGHLLFLHFSKGSFRVKLTHLRCALEWNTKMLPTWSRLLNPLVKTNARCFRAASCDPVTFFPRPVFHQEVWKNGICLACRSCAINWWCHDCVISLETITRRHDPTSCYRKEEFCERAWWILIEWPLKTRPL